MVVAIDGHRGVGIDGFILTGNPEVDGGTKKVKRGAVGAAEFRAGNQFGAQDLGKKIDGMFKIAAQQVDVVESVDHGFSFFIKVGCGGMEKLSIRRCQV
jgi:hypothetical protein